MTPAIGTLPLIDDELDFLADLVPLAGREIIEIGCGAAGLARSLLSRYPDSRVSGLEVDARQHANTPRISPRRKRELPSLPPVAKAYRFPPPASTWP